MCASVSSFFPSRYNTRQLGRGDKAAGPGEVHGELWTSEFDRRAINYNQYKTRLDYLALQPQLTVYHCDFHYALFPLSN